MRSLVRVRRFALSTTLCLIATCAHADTLRDIYELALKNDGKLRIAEATFKANLETEQQARSHLLPQINGDAGYGATRREQDSKGLQVFGTGAANNPFTFGTQNQSTDISTRNHGWGVGLSQQIFDLPAWFTFKSGRELSQQARAQFAADQQDLIVRVADAYFNVLRRWDSLQVSQSEERANKRQLDQAQQRFDVGLIAITDVDEARAAYDASVALRLTDEGDLATSYEVLTLLTGQSHANLWPLNKDFPVVDPAPAERTEWVQFALDNNYSLKAALFGMQAAQENATAKQMEHAPKVTGSLGYQNEHVNGSQDVDPESLFDIPPTSNTTTKTAMLRLTVPIFSGGYTSSVQRQAYEQYNEALERKIDTERTIIQATRAKFIASSTDVQRAKARLQSIVSAQSALDATQAGYEVGTRNIVDVLQSQRTLYISKRDYANARYDYVIDMLRLKQFAGILSPQDIGDLNNWLVTPDSPMATTYLKEKAD
ncbi:MAG TPA: TolC family outer membrane protein [Spongiibacteraceae bacterium]|nr:TolC family outer membrane protein [Spongiibacteraceae bacterium]